MNGFENNLASSLHSAGTHALKYSQAAKSLQNFLLDFQLLPPDILFLANHFIELIQCSDLQHGNCLSLTYRLVLLLILLRSHC